MKLLKQSFFERSTEIVAQDLIGKIIVRTINNNQLIARIIETEAYGSDNDAASHAARGKTNRNSAMFGPVGHLYIYISYGIHNCINIVSRDVSQIAGGVLIRAIQPLHGIEIMQKNRTVDDLKILTNGPGKVGQALELQLTHTGTSVVKTDSVFAVMDDYTMPPSIIATPRIGISKNKDVLWRFVKQPEDNL